MTLQRVSLFVLSLAVAASGARFPLLVLATLNKPDASSTVPHLQTHPMLQVPCSVQLVTDENDDPSRQQVTPLYNTFVDTGAQVSVLSQSAASKAGVLHMMDRRYAGHALGVGQCRVLGRLPAGILVFHLNGIPIPAPAVTVLEQANDGVDLLLGLDFLRDYKAILNLQTEEMILSTAHEGVVAIPFIRPRASNAMMNLGDDNSDVSSCYDQRLCNDYTDADSDYGEDDGAFDMSGL